MHSCAFRQENARIYYIYSFSYSLSYSIALRSVIVTLHGFCLNAGTEKDSRLTALILIFLALEFMPHLHNRK